MPPISSPNDTNGKSDMFLLDRQTSTIKCVSVASDGTLGNDTSWNRPALSADGRFIAFSSWASNLVEDDTNAVDDIFVHDQLLGTTEPASQLWIVAEANAHSQYPDISADGRYVAFHSRASNLVPGDTNNESDIFVHDQVTGVTERVSVASNGAQASTFSFIPSISDDGRFVSFHSDASNDLTGGLAFGRNVFVYDRDEDTIELASIGVGGVPANGSSYFSMISANGRYVTFQSSASNLVARDENGEVDIFVYDRDTGRTECVSVAHDGGEANDSSRDAAISGDGRFVVFTSNASNLVPEDMDSTADIFVYDRQQQTIELVSVADSGVKANGSCENPSISDDGRFVVFASSASNLVPEDTGYSDVFVFDRETDTIERVSVTTDGHQANGSSGIDYGDVNCLSADGRFVAYESHASNLVPGDDNGAKDIFVYDRQTRSVVCASRNESDEAGDLSSETPALSADGRYIAFESYANNLVSNDIRGACDVLVNSTMAADLPKLSNVTTTAGQSIGEVDFGNLPQPGQVRGQQFHDLDRDGLQDIGEPGLDGWTVYVDLNDNNILEPAEPSARTNSYGEYVISDLDPFGTYAVRVVTQEHWTQTWPTQANGGTWTVDIQAGTVVADIDFGFYYAGPDAQSTDVVTGVLYHDRNANGLQDANEPGLRDWIVELNSEDGQVQDTDTTDASGRYSFEGVTAGNYSVEAVLHADWTQTAPLENSLDATPFGEGLFDRAQAVNSGDFDDDGIVDMAVSHGDYVTLLRNTGSGSFEFWQEILVGSGAGALEVGDFNGDGWIDLVVANYYGSSLTILLNQKSPTSPLGPAITTETGSLPRSLAVGQFNDDNQDGKIDSGDYLDVAIAHDNGVSSTYENDNQVSILRGNGDGSFQPATYIAAGDSPVAIVTGQFNDDNHDGWINERDAIDLAVANADSKDVTVLINNGAGIFNAGVSVPVSDSSDSVPISLVAADLDRDGDIDLAVADLQLGIVSILFNVGNGSFIALPETYEAGTEVQALIAVDLEGDGDVDLLVTNRDDKHLGILRNFSDVATGKIRFAPLESQGVGNFSGGPAFSVIAEDLDGDADIDLAVAIGETDLRLDGGSSDAPQNYVSVLLNDVFQGAHHITVTGTEEVPELNFGVRPEGALPSVVGRHLFYNNSWFDGNDPAAGASDDTAIATDKEALLPGELAAFANYTSYTRGINGIMIDVADTAGTATIDDFAFLVGNSSDLSTWTPLAASDLPTVTVRAGAGVGGSDRITLTWADNTIQQQWLQITVLAGGNLGLVADDVFYFGNAIGDSGAGNPSGVATTFISDELGARNNPHAFLDRAPVDDAYDYNRDSIVFISDELIARNNQTNFLTGLKLITAPAAVIPLAMSASYVESDEIAEAIPSQQAEVDEYVDASMEDTDASWIYYDWFDELDRANDDCDEDAEETEPLVDMLAMLAVDTRP